MNKDIVIPLIDSMKGHPYIIPIDENHFSEILSGIDVKEDSSKFYIPLNFEGQDFREGDSFYTLNLRRLLRNKSAQDYKLSDAKKIIETIGSTFNVYDSDVMTRRARADGNIVKMMSESDCPFSLLGKLDESIFRDDRKEHYRSRPVLFIPGAKNLVKIVKWEDRNEIYERRGLFFSKKIGKKEFYSI